MESYPEDYLVHNLPLVILTGLEPNNTPETPVGEKSYEFLGDGGFRVRAEVPPLQHALTSDLRTALLSHDGSSAPWRDQTVPKAEQTPTFKIRSVGRTYTFPPRKAPPPPYAPLLRPVNDTGASPPPLVLHSTLSPLSPSSPLYPDGIVTPLWITKHQYRLPSVLVAFYNLYSDTSTASLEDNRIKNEVNSIRSLMNSTNYKTKFVLVLVADGPIDSSDLEERLVNIRRGTNFDTKALYFLPSASSKSELKDFAKVLFTTLYPTSIEYYRDLSKHARRKRNRNNVPLPTVAGKQTPLSQSGWNVRYEFKLGVFAETRQEIEAASRNYEQAYEGLFHPELIGILLAGGTRFNEARMLADVLAIRIIRCALWSSQTSVAVRWWTKHRNRVQDLVETYGKGTANYGWEAWQIIWSRAMTELISKSEVFPVARAQLPPGTGLPVQIMLDKSSTERQSPWEALHHEGYWLDLVRRHIVGRRKLAKLIESHGTLPESKSNNADTQTLDYDSYLTPEPAIETQLLNGDGESFSKRICETVDHAIVSYRARDQLRMIGLLHSVQAAEKAAVEDWPSVVRLLEPSWRQSRWRDEGWLLLLVNVAKSLFEAAKQLDDHELCLLLFWELSTLQHVSELSATLEPVDVSSAIDIRACLPKIVPNLAFATDSGHVGEAVAIQLSIRQSSSGFSAGFAIKEIKIAFDGGISPILLLASGVGGAKSDHTTAHLHTVELGEFNAAETRATKRLSVGGGSYWSGKADFTFGPGRRLNIYDLSVVPREAGSVTVASITTVVGNGVQELTISATQFNNEEAMWWESRSGQAVGRRFGMLRDVAIAMVHPKPPKAEIKIPNLATSYFTDEEIVLIIKILNAEDEPVVGHLQAELIGSPNSAVQLRWQHADSASLTTAEHPRGLVLPSMKTTTLGPGEATSLVIVILGLSDSVEHELHLQFSYTLHSNTTNTLTKQLIVSLPVVRPFEANAFFLPQVQSEDWPDFFTAPTDDVATKPQGLKQKFVVKANFVSFAQEALEIQHLELIPHRLVGDAISTSGLGRHEETVGRTEDGTVIESGKTKQFYFDLELQKLVLGDRAPVSAEYAIVVHWSRVASTTTNVSTLVLPKLLAPMSEPRVLLQVRNNTSMENMYDLSYTIENPSLHFLTFNITLESGDGFAFSGPKLKSMSLVPMSRYTIDYRILMQRNKEWVNVHLTVLDAFFGQVLRIIPASDGIRTDKEGQIQIWSAGLQTQSH